MTDARDKKTPKLLTRKHSSFVEETVRGPGGNILRMRKVATTRGTYWVVSVDGKRIDSFLTRGAARAKVKRLFNTLGAFQMPAPPPVKGPLL